MNRQLLHDQLKACTLDIREVPDPDLAKLRHCWLDKNLKCMPTFGVFCDGIDERRRRDIERASKPMKPFRKDFFK